MKKSFLSSAIMTVAGALTLGLASSVAIAATSTSTTTFQVTANVPANCSIAANDLNFGSYTGTLTTATSALNVTCTNSLPYAVGLDAGLTPAATTSTRAMQGPSSSALNYAIAQDSGHTTNWGNVNGTDTVAGTGTGASQTLTMYGQIPAGQNVRAGSYSDKITATLTY